MPTFDNNEALSSVRQKINTAIEDVEWGRGGFATVADLLSNSTLTNDGTLEGQIFTAGGFRYQRAASTATDHHVTTAGGVKLYVLPILAGANGGIYQVRAFGAACDDAANDSVAVQKSADVVGSIGGTLMFPNGTTRCNITINGAKDVFVAGQGPTSFVRSFDNNEFAIKFEGQFVRSVVSDLTVIGNSKLTHGIYFNTGSQVSLRDVRVLGCGIGICFNGTIDTTLTACWLAQNYVGVYYTCRTTAGSPTVEDINGQDYTFTDAFFPQQPGESNLFGCTFNVNNFGVILDQPDNPYDNAANIKFFGGLIQSSSCIGILCIESAKIGPPSVVIGTWFEDNGSGSNADFDGVTYTEKGDFWWKDDTLDIQGTWIFGGHLKGNARLILRNVEVRGEITKDALSAIRLESGTIFYGLPALYTPAPIPIGYTLPQSSVCRIPPRAGYSYAFGSKVKGSNKLMDADSVSFFGAGSSSNVSDGVLDVKECKEISLTTAGNGIRAFTLTGGKVSGKYYLGLIAIKHISGDPSLILTNEDAGAPFGSVIFDVASTWQIFAFMSRPNTTSSADPINFIAPLSPTTVIRISASCLLAFDTEEELAEFIDARCFPLV